MSSPIMRTLRLPSAALLIGAALTCVGCPAQDWTPPTLAVPDAAVAQGMPSVGGSGSASAPAGPAVDAPPAAGGFGRGVSVTLEAADGSSSASGPILFGLPLPRGAVKKLDDIVVIQGNRRLDVRLRALLPNLRSVLIELPGGTLPSLPATLDISFAGGGTAKASKLAFAAVSRPVDVKVPVARYGVESRGSQHAAVARNSGEKLLFSSIEPKTIVHYARGYLARTGILGDLLTRADLDAQPQLAGMSFLSDALSNFANGAMFASTYPLDPESVVLETEAWLYDRCATYLLAYAHAGDPKHLRYGLRTCARYARDIGLSGERRGIFEGKKERDLKYSHARGLYAYYALTGDDAALEAVRAMADMWDQDQQFVGPYRSGSTRAVDKLWTERLLAASIEGGVYGHLATGEAKYLASARALVKTALRHISTNDATELRTITKTPFPPQSCFIHNALQQAEGNETDPWCSSWMSELVIDPLMRYAEVTGEHDVDEVFVRLARSMRDVGTTYFQKNPLGDSFLSPSRPFSMGEDPRLLVPLYGYGLDAKGARKPEGEWSDFEHCPDASAITAAALMVLRQRNAWDSPPVPAAATPAIVNALKRFKSEGESILALHNELAFCAAQTFKGATRMNRDPARATESTLASIAGSGSGEAMEKAASSNKIGWPIYAVVPGRKLSWWFNTSIGELAWLSSARASLPTLRPGTVNP